MFHPIKLKMNGIVSLYFVINRYLVAYRLFPELVPYYQHSIHIVFDIMLISK